jgi:hypothetical protein
MEPNRGANATGKGWGDRRAVKNALGKVGQAAAAGVISAQVAALTQGVLKTMLVNKLKVAAAVMLGVLVCVGGGRRRRRKFLSGRWFPLTPLLPYLLG